MLTEERPVKGFGIHMGWMLLLPLDEGLLGKVSQISSYVLSVQCTITGMLSHTHLPFPIPSRLGGVYPNM